MNNSQGQQQPLVAGPSNGIPHPSYPSTPSQPASQNSYYQPTPSQMMTVKASPTQPVMPTTPEPIPSFLPTFTTQTPFPPQPPVSEDADDQVDELDDGNATDDDEDPNMFKIRDPLKPPKKVTYTTKELHAQIHQGDIDLEPPYQRDVVWPETKQIRLIDSLFRNFYIPPVVLAETTDEDGQNIKVCVDGKQRLTSIQKFMDGHIPHQDDVTKRKFWYTSLAHEGQKSSRQEIPEKYKKLFANIEIQCVEYTSLSEPIEREIFQRVQLGVSLTAAEKLQAIASPWAAWISSLEQKHVHIENGLATLFEWDISRGRDFQNIAHMVYCCDCLPEYQQIPTAQKIEKWLHRNDTPSSQFQKAINHVLEDMTFLANNHERLNKGFKMVGKRVAPVEFVFIGVLLYVMRDAPDADRAGAIYNMRRDVRSKHKDIRMNTAVGKTLWKFINGIEVDRRKRKRDDYDSDDREYRPAPVYNTRSTRSTRARR